MNIKVILLLLLAFKMVFFACPVYCQICNQNYTALNLYQHLNISSSHYEFNVNQIWTPVQITLKSIRNNPYLKKCYDSRYGKENLDIFTQNINNIIRIFFVCKIH